MPIATRPGGARVRGPTGLLRPAAASGLGPGRAPIREAARARSGAAPRLPGNGAVAEERNREVEVLRLALADVEKERDRLRNARASWTARLGPLPAAAAVATGIIAAKSGEVDPGWAAAAGVLLVLLLGVSVRYSVLKPYRELRHDYQAKFDPGWRKEGFGFRVAETDLVTWLDHKIKLEERICGAPGERRSRWLPTTNVKSLTHALNVERAAANIVYALSLAIFVVLVVGTIFS